MAEFSCVRMGNCPRVSTCYASNASTLTSRAAARLAFFSTAFTRAVPAQCPRGVYKELMAQLVWLKDLTPSAELRRWYQ